MPYGRCLNPKCSNEIADYGLLWCRKCRIHLPFFERLKIFKERVYNINKTYLLKGSQTCTSSNDYKKLYWERRHDL